MATKLKFLVTKFKVLVALVTVSVAILSPDIFHETEILTTSRQQIKLLKPATDLCNSIKFFMHEIKIASNRSFDSPCA